MDGKARGSHEATEALVGDIEALTLSAPATGADPFDAVVSNALPAFSTVKDLGIFIWRPQNPKRVDFKPHADTTEQDIASRLVVAPKPTDVPVLHLENVKLPIDFARNIRPQPLANRFPNDHGVAAALAAAAARGIQMNSVDFVLGGSALNVLSTRSTAGKVYLVQRAHNAITIGKHSEYTSDLSARGFQFERLCTGEGMAARANEDCAVSMQLALVGPSRTVFHAELDAVDASGSHVEIKSGNPHKFGSKEMYQMVASRSRTLVFARCQGNTIVEIEQCGIEDVAKWLTDAKRATLQDAILETMRELKELAADISEDEPSQLVFVNGHVQLSPRPDLSQLPSREVVASLLTRAAVDTP